MTHSRSESSDRGQSETLGFALVVGVAVLAAVAAAALGLASLDGEQATAGVEAAERSLSQFDARASEVALGRADGTRVAFGLPDDQGTPSVRPDAGRMRVEYVAVGPDGQPNVTVVTNVTLGSVVYQQGDRSVGYQAGGVFRADGNGSVVVTRPEFHYRDGTLTVPVVVTEGERTIASTVQVRPNGTVRAFPDPSRNLTNELSAEPRKVRITVQSEYYAAWAQYFRSETASAVTVDPVAETATVTFLTGPRTGVLASGIIATGDDGEIRLAGNGVYVDSYNSAMADGTYANTRGYDGELTAVGNITSTGSATVEGDLRSGETVDLSGTTDINNGTVYWTESFSQDGASVSGPDDQIDGVATVEPIDGYVEGVVQNASADNDNANTSVIQSDSFNNSGTLGAGTYYVDDLVVGPGETLTLDTSGGNVTVAVAGYAEVAGQGTKADKAATLDVTGGNTARIVVAGRNTTDVSVSTGESVRTFDANFHVGKNARVDVPAERSPQLRIYGTQSFTGVIASDNSPAALRFEGIVYAPGGLDGSSELFVKQGSYYGGAVATDLTFQQNADVHYDRRIENLGLPRAPTAPRLRFLHVSVNRMNVTAG